MDIEYNVWIEPVICFGKDPTEEILMKSKPDLVITKDSTTEVNSKNCGNVEAIIEVKFTPWSYVNWKYDIKKLNLFNDICKTNNNTLLLGWKPVNPNWKEQMKEQDSELRYSLNENTILGFFVGTHYQAKAVYTLPEEEIPNDLLHLVGYFKEKETIYLGESTKDYLPGFAQ